jgi:hypothetical protein
MTEECPVCFECPQLGTAVLTPCAHMFCSTCLVDALNEASASSGSGPAANHKTRKSRSASAMCADGPCPSCNEIVDASRIIALRRCKETGQATTTYLAETTPFKKKKLPVSDVGAVVNKPEDDAARKTLEAGLSGAMNSAKLQAVLQELQHIWTMDPKSKVIMFSQFLGCLDLLEGSLGEANIPFGRLDGKMTMQQRVQVLDDFKHSKTNGNSDDDDADGDDDDNKGSVLLVSMKAGGVGINLVAASSVFIIDPVSTTGTEMILGQIRFSSGEPHYVDHTLSHPFLQSFFSLYVTTRFICV